MDMLKQLRSKLDRFKKPVPFFVATALISGVLFMLITPPFQTPDETVHFYRAYQISEGKLTVDQGPQFAGGMMPDWLGQTVVVTSTDPWLSFTPQAKYKIGKTKEALHLKDMGTEHFYDFSPTALNPPIAYIPQAIGIFLARVLGFPPIVMMYTGRFMNLLVWILLIAVAIRLIPYKKWAVAFVGLLPMAVFQAMSLGADVMTIGLLAVFFSAILALRQSGRAVTWRIYAGLMALAVGFVLCKQVMFIFLPLILLLPNKSFKTNRTAYVTKLLTIIVPLLAYGLWMFATRHIDIHNTFNNGQVPGEQIKFVIRNPHKFLAVLWNDYFFSYGDQTTRSFIGNFGWMDTPLSELLVAMGYLGLFLVMNATPNGYRAWLDKRQKQFVLLIAVAYWVAVNGALYAYYSPVKYSVIIGVQGRYFLPLGLLAIPVLHSNWLKISPRAHRYLVMGLPIFLLASSAITIFFRYYVTSI